MFCCFCRLDKYPSVMPAAPSARSALQRCPGPVSAAPRSRRCWRSLSEGRAGVSLEPRPVSTVVLQPGRPCPTFLPAPSLRGGLLARAVRQQEKAKQGANSSVVHNPPRGGEKTLHVHGGETVLGAAASQCAPRSHEPDFSCLTR